MSLDCPSECVYLQEARKHERRGLKDLPREALFPQVEVREQFLYEREPLLTGLSFALAKAARADRTPSSRVKSEISFSSCTRAARVSGGTRPTVRVTVGISA